MVQAQFVTAGGGEALEEHLGSDSEFFTAGSYAGLVESLTSGDPDIAVMSPFADVVVTGHVAEAIFAGQHEFRPRHAGGQLRCRLRRLL